MSIGSWLKNCTALNVPRIGFQGTSLHSWRITKAIQRRVQLNSFLVFVLHVASNRSKQGFPFIEKRGKNADLYKCYECVGSFHCIECQEWIERVSSRECHCKKLENSAELFKIENSFKKKCSSVDKSFWKQWHYTFLSQLTTLQLKARWDLRNLLRKMQ